MKNKCFFLAAILAMAVSTYAQNVKPKTAIPGLPPGITLSTSEVLSGTPTAFGVYDFTVKVCDG